MKQLINEVFNVKNGTKPAKNGKSYNIAYIDPGTSESTFDFRDIIKKYGAKYIADMKTWGWFLGNNAEKVYQQFINPCLQELRTVEDEGKGTRTEDDINAAIDELLAELKSGKLQTINAPNVKRLSEQLIKFKSDLMNCLGSDRFKKMMEPIIKYKRAQGHHFSYKNALQIMLQDPEATMVKSRSSWKINFNRYVFDQSHPILLWRPDTDSLTKEDRDQIRAEFLNSAGVRSVKELTPGQREELGIQLRGGAGVGSFSAYFGYDKRFTKVIEGKEDLVGNGSADLPISSSDKTKTEYLSSIIECIKKMIVDSGVKIRYVPDKELKGALGYATPTGEIVMPEGTEPILDNANTLFHEFAHHLLHLKYLKTVDKGGQWAQYYVGTDKGRGYVEQQAEMCAWLTLKHFDYDVTDTSVTYAAGWGMTDPKIAAKIFDSISQAASFMADKVDDLLNSGEGAGEVSQEIIDKI